MKETFGDEVEEMKLQEEEDKVMQATLALKDAENYDLGGSRKGTLKMLPDA